MRSKKKKKINFPRHTDYLMLNLCTNRSNYTDDSVTYIHPARQRVEVEFPDLFHEGNL